MRNLDISHERLEEICRRYHVERLAVFGSALREDFRPESDIDILVTFEPEAPIGFLALGRMQRELEALFGRSVDLVPQEGLKPYIRDEVLVSAEPIYADGTMQPLRDCPMKTTPTRRQHDDPGFPEITYRLGASGTPTPVVRGTGIRVQTLVVAHQQERRSVAKIADEYPLTPSQVKEALSFYAAHQAEIDRALEAERTLEAEQAWGLDPLSSQGNRI